MNKLFSKISMFLMILTLVMLSKNSMAIDLAWDHDDPASVSGYTLYYAPVDESSGPYLYVVNGGSVLTATIPDDHFQPNVEYSIYATAWNLGGESGMSNVITVRRNGWGPPVSVPPSKIWTKPGNPKTLIEVR